MTFFELEAKDISNLNDSDLRELVGRLCEAELTLQDSQPSCVTWGGAQEAPDGGLDVRVRNAVLEDTGFIPCTNTGFQVKKSSMTKSSCKKEMIDGEAVKSVIYDLASKKGAYIIVSGKDDCSDKMLSERISGMKEAVENLSNKDYLTLDFYGRDRLATWLRKFPGVVLWVRSRLGKPLLGWKPFGQWTTIVNNCDDEFLLDDSPCITDRNSQSKEPMSTVEGIKLVCNKLRKSGSNVRIIGLSGVGKTRFAQALFETDICEEALPKENVVYADLGNELAPTASDFVSYLIANKRSVYVVLDNCPPDVHRQLQKQISEQQVKLSLLTIEYDIVDDTPEETDVIHIEPSSEQLVSKLIQKRFPQLGEINSDKIAEFSGGNARVAIALGNRVEVDDTLTNFSDEELFKRLFNQRKETSGHLLEGAEMLSLVYSFKISQSESHDELSVLSVISRTDRSALHRDCAELLRRQLAQERGEWKAILPHALANRLASRALENIPLQQINAELFKPDNLRLFQSCAHRLGYLHDSKFASKLIETWLQDGAPLGDIAVCNTGLLKIIEYIAPVSPKKVLSKIEEASTKSPKFFSRDNKNFSIFVELLQKIAYDDAMFDRASELILKFAITEKANEKFNSIVSELQSFFSLYLSGTNATPKRRQTFLSNLLNSSNLRHFEIAHELFASAFQAASWSSMENFSFGARSRDSGWIPKTQEEKLDWYVGFIEILQPLLDSKDRYCSAWARQLLVNHFGMLWSYASCFDILEKIIFKHAGQGNWSEMWIQIKELLEMDDNRSTPELSRLEKLERFTQPSGLHAEIQAYVFSNISNHIGMIGFDLTEIEEKILTLGRQVATKHDYLERLASKLWENRTSELVSFGEGLALGSTNQGATFEFLIELMQKQNLAKIHPSLFRGFIYGTYTRNSNLARKLQKRVLEIPELKLHFVFLLLATPVESWGIKKLIELACLHEIEANQFYQIAGSGIHKTVSDKEFSQLLLAINKLKRGVSSTIAILNHYSLITELSVKLQLVGRKTICKLFSEDRDVINSCDLKIRNHFLEVCLSNSAPKPEIRKIIESLCEYVESLEFGCSNKRNLERLIKILVINFPEFVLSRVFEDSKNTELLVDTLFMDRSPMFYQQSVLNSVSVNRIVKWCSGNQNRIKQVATAVSSYVPMSKEIDSWDNHKQVMLSDHIKSLLEISENKSDIVEIIFSGIHPRFWSGLLSIILTNRSKAFAELLDHSSSEVRTMVKTKLFDIEKEIEVSKSYEEERNAKRERRFE